MHKVHFVLQKFLEYTKCVQIHTLLTYFVKVKMFELWCWVKVDSGTGKEDFLEDLGFSVRIVKVCSYDKIMWQGSRWPGRV